MAFTDSFIKPRTGFNEVLSGLEDVTARFAEGFAKDPAVRAQKQIARIRKQELEETSQNQRIESGVRRLQALGAIVQQFAENGQPTPDGLVQVIRRAGSVLAEDDPNIAEQWTEGILSLTKLRAGEENIAEEARQTALGKATGEVQGALLRADALRSAPPEQQELLARSLGLDQRGSFEFLALLDEKERLTVEGQANTPRAQLVDRRIEAKMNDAAARGVNITIGTDPSTGRLLTRIEGGASGTGAQAPGGETSTGGLAPALTGAQALSADQRIALVDDAVSDLDRQILRTETDPEDFGPVASVRTFVQEIGQGLQDVASLASKATGGAVDFNQVSSGLADAFGVENIFDPDLPAQQIFETRMTLALAKLRLARGGEDVRALGQVFKDARRDVTLTGFTSTSQTVKARLQEIRREFNEERQALTSGLTGQAIGSPEAQVESPGGTLTEQDNQILAKPNAEISDADLDALSTAGLVELQKRLAR